MVKLNTEMSNKIFEDYFKHEHVNFEFIVKKNISSQPELKKTATVLKIIITHGFGYIIIKFHYTHELNINL